MLAAARGLVALLASSLALVACGGDGGGESLTKEQYQERLEQASTELSQASQAFGSELGKVLGGEKHATAAAADALAPVEEELQQTADELEDVEPPEDVQETNDELAAALRAYAEDLALLKGSLEEGDLSDVRERLGELQRLDSVEDLRRLGDELRELGYTFET